MRIFVLVIFFTLSSVASDSSLNLEVEILSKVLNEISIDKKKILWTDNKKISEAIQKQGTIQTTQDCTNATILIIQDIKKLPEKCSCCIVFVLDYKLLSQLPKSFGAFFWKKGRPNIVILKSRLKALSIEASSDLDPYLESKIW